MNKKQMLAHTTKVAQSAGTKVAMDLQNTARPTFKRIPNADLGASHPERIIKRKTNPSLHKTPKKLASTKAMQERNRA